MPYRIAKLLIQPLRALFARIAPVAYARAIGVSMAGRVRIYGSSLYMFSTEPYLVSLGDNVFISVGATFVCHDGSTLPFRARYPQLEVAAPIRVGNNVFIGMKAMILPGVTIGDNCIIGASAVVTKDVPSGQIVAGNPARMVKTTEQWLAQKQATSLEIGHLYGWEKVRAYKRIFAGEVRR